MSERRSNVAADDGASRAFVLDQQIRYRYSRPVSNVRQRLKIVVPITVLAHGEGLELPSYATPGAAGDHRLLVTRLLIL